MESKRPLTTVGGLLRDAAGNVLLVRTHKWSNLWGIPGGKVEYGETLEAAFVRETREETGLEARNTRLVMVQEAVEHPEFHEPRHFVLINYVADTPGERPAVTLNDEAEEWRWLSLAEAGSLPLNGPTRALLEKITADLRRGESVWAP